jgi:hypothetical protein
MFRTNCRFGRNKNKLATDEAHKDYFSRLIDIDVKSVRA